MKMRGIWQPIRQAVSMAAAPVRRRIAAGERHRAIRAAVSSVRAQTRLSADANASATADPAVKRVWQLAPSTPTAGKLAIFAHFDSEGEVSAAVIAYIAAIHDAGFSVVFVSSSPQFIDATVDRLRPYVSAVVWRANIGHDFGAWRDGLAHSGSVSLREGLLLANDSVYGPLSDFDEILSQFDDGADVWALTESLEIERHLQSYFLYFRPPALQSHAFNEFWSTFRAVPGRDWAVHFGELALSQHLRARGLRLRAIVGYKSARHAFRKRNRMLHVRECAPHPREPMGRSEVAFLLNDGHNVNPTHYFWRELIDDFGLPFIKRDLIDRNPEVIADIEDARGRVDAWLTTL